MFRNLERFSYRQRLLIFILIIGGGLALLVGATAALVFQAFNPSQRQQSVVLTDAITVSQFAALPDDDAYPAALAVAPDGTVYTGSFATGAVWAIDASGMPTRWAARMMAILRSMSRE